MAREEFHVNDSEEGLSSGRHGKGYFIQMKYIVIILLLFLLAIIGVALGLGIPLAQSSSSSSQVSDDTTQKPPVDQTTAPPGQTSSTPTKPSQTTTTTTTTTEPSITSTTTPDTTNYRLPTNLVPYHYDILTNVQFTTLDGNRFPYTGTTTIIFICNENTKTIKLHINNLDIDKSSLVLKGISDPSFTQLNAFDWRYEEKTQFFIADISQEFKVGNIYSITIGYTGYLQDDNVGFYRSSYTDENGNKRWLLASQMEPTDARKSFPCFDEPALKATFSLSVIHPDGYNARSNMPATSVKRISARQTRTDFEKTPPMSSYLVALVVSDFVCITGQSNAGLNNGKVEVNVCSRPNAKDQLDYALDIAIKAMDYFRVVYDVEFPLPKCDHVAIPDFAAGAMENWGLITYREGRLLYVDGVTSQTAEQDIAAVIAHELAHMWFGDYVSPKWWNDLWLNEGFARYMQYVGTAFVKPDWFMYDQLLSHLFGIMQSDSVPSSHAISVDVNRPDEINEIFDDISYGKGAAVIQMTNYFLANATFRRGITQYLSRKNYSNAEEDDLWNSLYNAADNDGRPLPANLSVIMHTWTRQMGYPVVDAKLTSAKNQLELTQKHFLLNPEIPASEPSAYDYKWHIPFTYSREKIGQANPTLFQANANNLFNRIEWFLANEAKKTINLATPLADDEFIIANLDGMGYFRVNYDEKNWNNIIKQLNLNSSLIPLRHRAQIINDAFSIAQAGDLDIQKAFEVIKYLPNENEYFPWITTIGRLRYLTDMIESTTAYSNLQEYLRQLISPIYKKLGWESKKDDSWLQRLLRTSVIRFACEREVPECINEAQNRYAEWMQEEGSNNIPAGYRSLVYCTAIRYGGDKEWRFAAQQYVKETDSNHRNDLQSGMSCATQPHLLTQYLKDQLDTNIVRKQDTITGLRVSASRATANAQTWQFVKDNWKELFDRYGNGLSFARLVADISAKLNTQKQYNDFESFFNGVQTGSATREVKVSKDKIKTNIRWISKNYELLNDWLIENVKPVDNSKPTDVRLPTDIVPLLYEIKIQPYIGNGFGAKSFRFDGDIKIHFKCVKPTNQIIFHIKDLDIHNDTISLATSSDGLQLQSRWENDFPREFFKMNFTKQCTQNTNYTLSMKYEGPIAKQLSGFYQSSYVDKNTGETNYLATTHFQPTDARRAFPCFDEPGMKAVFRLQIVRHKNFSSSFANMPHIEFGQPIAGTTDWYLDTFNDTLPMSTYLVAFVVSNFKNITKVSKEGYDIQVAAKPDAIDTNQGAHALEEAASIIDYFSEYFNVSYPLPKSTQIAVPDFNAGAMENWGLVIYRETQLLYVPGDALSAKRRVSVVVSHELAHQWFGNLVTPDWWNDLWLNEGFASWVEYIGYNHTHPEWDDLNSFFTQTMISVLVKDSLESSHPISVDVKNPDDINSLFDSISYNKGASIIRMMNAFLTENTFKKGVTRYLNKYRLGNAIQDNLWEQLTIQAHDDSTLDKSLTVKDIMDTWTTQKGYPVVYASRDYDKSQIVLTQEWFLLDPNSDIPQSVKDKQKWYVGFSHTTHDIQDFDFQAPVVWLLPSVAETVVKTDASTDDWIIGNLQHSGYYRVNYDQNNWNLLIQQLRDDHEVIHKINRAQLLDDSFNLGKAGLIEQIVFLDIVKYLKNEEDAIPWSAASSGLAYLSQMLASETFTYAQYKIFYAQLYKRIYDKYAWDEGVTDAATIDLQLSSMSAECSFDYEPCINKAKDYFRRWLENKEEIPGNFKAIVYQTAIRYGTEKDWSDVFETAKNTTDSGEQLRLFRALASSRDYGLLRFLLTQTKDGGAIRPQDATSIISAVASNVAGRTLAWDFIVDNWDLLIRRYGGTSFTLPNLVISVLQRYNSDFEYNKVKDFRNRYQSVLGVATGAFKESLETIKININWMNKNSKEIIQWLTDYNNSNKPI